MLVIVSNNSPKRKIEGTALKRSIFVKAPQKRLTQVALTEAFSSFGPIREISLPSVAKNLNQSIEAAKAAVGMRRGKAGNTYVVPEPKKLLNETGNAKHMNGSGRGAKGKGKGKR
ncbi:hypothetical protein HDU97_008218 [Phlyctochytrium planicorne]|nr:hypothetical protein HDU97_008218 [Phlyctochytrium planicorne]